ALGRDEDVGGVAAVRGERLGDERLVVADLVGVEVVGVGGVDEGDAGVQGGVDGRHRAGAVRATLDGHRHAAEPDRTHPHVPDAALLHVILLVPAAVPSACVVATSGGAPP